ncbi:hypothetical protein [Nocardioides sp. SR21]|uniref:hypothetical protein n=1 Tax=Nocardioides sp. SR21 TaxID=2919501 RepID=UPI001FA983E6|nr:hypothetical protein [Nocardioides sp. SR21]
MAKTLITLAALSLVALTTGCGESDTTTKGSCDGRAYELSAESDKDHTEISFELSSQTSGETWQVVIDQDGESILDTSTVTDEEGELDADVTVAASDDESTFTVTATPESGGPCTASIDH